MHRRLDEAIAERREAMAARSLAYRQAEAAGEAVDRTGSVYDVAQRERGWARDPEPAA
jgi:hypothetical protein